MPTLTVDKTSQTFYSTDQPEADVVVIHTTEGMTWPGYSGGGEAPHATIRAIPGKGIQVREHIAFTKFAKALMNLPGGVETNRRGVLQFELVGTCDPKHKGNSSWYFWPDADDVVLQALADYLRPLMERFDIPPVAPDFLPYPASYGSKNGQRMSGPEWVAFQGICGHQHVPENDHGDPGAFPVTKLIAALKKRGTTPTPAKDWFDMATQADLKAVVTDPSVLAETARFVATGFTWRGTDGKDRVLAGHLAQIEAVANAANARVAALAAVVGALSSGTELTADEVMAAAEAGAKKALDEKIVSAEVKLGVAGT